MSYVLFRNLYPKKSGDMIKVLSTLLLTPESAIEGFDVTRVYTDKKFKSYSFLELLVQIQYLQFETSVMSIFKFTEDFETDRYLIESFGDTYIGIVSNTTTKEELLGWVLHLEKIENIKSLLSTVTPRTGVLEGRMDLLELNEKERKEIESIVENTAVSIKNWTNVKLKTLDLSPKLIIRDY